MTDVRARIQAERSALEEEFLRHWRAVAAARAWLLGGADELLTGAEGRAAALRQKARARQEQSLVADQRTEAETHKRATSVLATAVHQLAPRCASAPFEASDFDVGPAEVRFGTTFRIGHLVHHPGLPVLLPLLGTSGWLVDGSRSVFRGVMHGVILRLLFTCHPRQVRVHTYDPDLDSNIGLFAAVRQVDRESIPAALTSPAELETLLEELIVTLAAVEDDLTAQGITSLTAGGGIQDHLAHPVCVLVLNGVTAGLSDTARTRLAQLSRIGADRGLVILARTQTARDAGLDERRFISIDATGTRWTSPLLPGVPWLPDPVITPDRIRACAAVLVAAPRIELAPTIELQELIEAIEDPWLDDGIQGVEAVIGRTGRANLVLRLRTEDPPMPNALVGGAVGQGKSTLLHGIIHTLAARYSPVDLEMVLVDLRDGVEFAQYGPDARNQNWLPHIRALGLDYDPDFAVAVLRWISTEMERRSGLLRAAGVARFSDYRRLGRVLPRLLVVIDEFHRLFTDDETGQEATVLLEHIARTARGFGIHLILSSQTVSGISGLATKADAIFSQFHNRLSLKNTEAESRALLATQNTAAARLSHRGEVVLNESLGQPDHNIRGQTAYGAADYLHSLRAQLWQQAGAMQPPLIFWAKEYAQWDTTKSHVAAAGELELALGAPISLSERVRRVTLRNAPDQAVVLLGPDHQVLRPTLRAAVHEAAASRPSLVVQILDGAGRADATPWLADLAAELTAAGASVGYHLASAVPAQLSDLAAEAKAPTLVLPVGLDQLPDLHTPPPGSFDSPVDLLRQLVQSGATSGVHVIGWWESRHRLEDHLGFGLPGVRGMVLGGMGKEDLATLCGPLTRPPSGGPRILWFDRNSHAGAETLVPFAPKGSSDD